MEREGQAKQAAIDRYGNNGNESQYMLGKIQAFVTGVKWADNNPKPVHIVMRCEGHSDYPEKVFVDKAKADAYCRQFDDNPNEYGRTIETLEVTL